MDSLLLTPATIALIVITCITTVMAWSDRNLEDRYIFHVHAIKARKEWHRLITSGFLHGGLLHLFFNMYVLWSFGGLMERILGTVGFVFVYFAALLGGSLWSLLENHRNPLYRAYGASGAISGILIGFCMYAPFATLSLFFAIPMPALVFAFIFIAGSAYLSSREDNLGNIGHDAHLGGALVGGVATVLVNPDVWTRFVRSLSSVFGL